MTSKTKFTPGPWRVSYERNVMTINAADKSLMGDETYYPWVPDNDADWHLIAAAPDLYAALEAIEYQMGGESAAVKKR